MKKTVPFMRLGWLALAGFTTAAMGELPRGEFREVNAVASPAAGRAVAIAGARLIDGRGGPPVENAVVVVRDSRIVAAGTRDSVEIPRGADVFEAKGLTLLPGLIDTHLHTAISVDVAPIFLRAGVTAARDPGVGLDRYDEAIRSGRGIPRMFLTDRFFDQEPTAHPRNARIITTAAQAKAAVDEVVGKGATGIKIYFRLPADLIRATCEAADVHGIPVVAHLELVDASAAIAAGLDGLEHVTSVGTDVAEPAAAAAFRAAFETGNQARHLERYKLWANLDLESPRVKSMLELLARERVVLSPTLTFFYGHGPGSKTPTDQHRRAFANMLRFVGKCHAAGVSVTVGSHLMLTVEPEGKAFQREMEFLVEAGMPRMDAIVAATMGGAKYLRADKRIGSIEPGKLADLILIEGNPLQDIRTMKNIKRVMLNGVWVNEGGHE